MNGAWLLLIFILVVILAAFIEQMKVWKFKADKYDKRFKNYDKYYVMNVKERITSLEETRTKNLIIFIFNNLQTLAETFSKREKIKLPQFKKILLQNSHQRE